MSAEILPDRDALARHICWEQYDCAREWADCDHAFGYRDADLRLSSDCTCPWLIGDAHAPGCGGAR